MKKIIIAISLIAGAVLSAGAKNINGTVKDTEGKGVAGVVVSDGLNTALTDAKGRYATKEISELEISDTRRSN